jgi:carboxymethylenebutenolidase
LGISDLALYSNFSNELIFSWGLIIMKLHIHAFSHFRALSAALLIAFAATAFTQEMSLPPSADTAKQALDTSPRHGEYAQIKVADSDKPMPTYVVFPERAEKAPAVIVIHEIFGLSDWIRSVADALAKEGFIALAPDLISGKGPTGGDSASINNTGDIRKLVSGLDPNEVVARLNAVRDHAIALPACNGKTATIGFCWGGATSFNYASAQPGLNAAVVYYGTSPVKEKFASIKAPVLGLYGENDARVNATIEPAKAEMSHLGKTYEVEKYAGAGHGFLRQQGGMDGANLEATKKAWPRTIEFLRKHTQ